MRRITFCELKFTSNHDISIALANNLLLCLPQPPNAQNDHAKWTATWRLEQPRNLPTHGHVLGHLVNPPELHHDSGVDLSVDSKSLLAWLNRYIGDLLCDCMLYCTIMYIQCVHAWPILSEWLTPTQIPQKHIGHPQTLPDRELYTKIIEIKIKISYHILNQHISVHTSRP